MNNISKTVIIKENAKRFGYILDVALDTDNFELNGYYVVEEETENEFFVAIKEIVILQDCAFVQDVSKLQFVVNKTDSLMFKKVLSNSGIDLGEVIDLVFYKRRCKKLITSKCEIKTNSVGKVGDVILLGKKNKMPKTSKFLKTDVDTQVEVMQERPKLPEKISLSTNYYLGKISGQDIFGYNNERLVSRGEKITKPILDRVKKHNRLNQLFFALKKW